DGIRDKLVTGVQTCALPIFIGWNQREALLVGELAADRLAVFGVAVIEHHLAAIALRCRYLRRRRVLRHHDGGRDAEQPHRQRDRSEERRVGKEGTSAWSAEP